MSGIVEQVVWIKTEENEDGVISVTDTSEEDEEQTMNSAQKKQAILSCNVCKKAFTSRYALTRHTRIHGGGVTFDCPTCGKRFNDKSNLIQHERIHTGEKRYVCEECNARFTHKATLNSHQVKHTGLKPHSCEHCGMRFARVHTMKKHVGRKHGENRKRKRGRHKKSDVYKERQ